MGHFRVAPGLCFKARLSANLLIGKRIFKTHSHNKGFAFSLVLKVESLGTHKWRVENAVCPNQAVPFLRNVSQWLQTELTIFKMLKIKS